MQSFSLSPRLGLLLLNVMLASLVISFAAIVVAFLVRRLSLSLRHGLLCVALVLTLASPFLIWVGGSRDVGIISVSLLAPGREAPRSVILVPRTPTIDEANPLARTSELDAAASGEPATPARERHMQAARAGTNSLVASLAANATAARPSFLIRQTLNRLAVLLALVWAAVALCLSIRLARGLLVIRQLRRSLQPTTDQRLIAAASRVATDSAVCPAVFESDLAPAPLTLGWWRSAIVMPRGLAELLNDEELECVLAHEAAHVARHDTAVALLQQLSTIGLWWNPMLRAVNRQINQLRERICDAYVVRQFGDGLPLARALVRVAEWSSCRDVAIPLASTLLDDNDDIENRVARLADRERQGEVGLNARTTALISLFGIALAIVSLVPVMRAQVVGAPPTKTASIAGWQVRIRAVKQNGKPIENARVGVRIGGDKEPTWYDSDQDGSYLATIPTRTPRYCYLLVRADGHAPMRAFWWNDTDNAADLLPAEFTFEMTKAVTVGGTVVDPDGKPVSGATVLFSAREERVGQARREQVTFNEEKYTTDDLGRWRCHLAPEKISSATINVTHPEFSIDNRNYSLDKQIDELRQLTHRSTLKSGFVVTGRVVGEEGAPIEGATLTLCELNTSSHEGPFARTDADGRYRFERVSPRYDLPSDDDAIRFTISIVKSGFAPVIQSVPGYGRRPLNDSTKKNRIVDFTLRQGVPLTLRVFDSQKQPIKGAWVLPDNWRDTTALRVLQQFGIPRHTDEQGVWKWMNAPAGEQIGYDVMQRGFADVRNHTIEVTNRAVEETIVLKQPQIITGTVIDAESRKPIAEFVVERAFENMAGYPDGLSWTSDSTRGKDGEYRKRVTMPSDSYTYRVLAEGYKPAVSKSTRFTEGKTKVNFELHRDKPQHDASSRTNVEKAKDEREARLAKVELDFKKIYHLKDNEVLRHIPEPLDRDLRLKWYNAVFGSDRGKDDRMHIVTLYLQWKDKRPQWKGATVGFGKGGMPIRSVLMMLDAVSPQYIEGEAALLDRKIPGDWVFDPQAPADEIVAAMQPVLRNEWGIPVKLSFRDVERDVYVVSGEWEFKPISDDFSYVQVYGVYLDKDSGNGSGTGGFNKFLAKVGSWIEMPIVNEVPEPPSKNFSWRYHMPSPTTQQQRDDSHNPESVTANLTTQTGLKFVKERRTTRVLFVEQ
jgi:beta-lactamase regulating signal transducer with metallopeptidase domain